MKQLNGITYDFEAVSFANQNNGIAVGGAGTILKTTNGGTNWTQRASGTSYDLLDVSFPDELNATAVGRWGVICDQQMVG